MPAFIQAPFLRIFAAVLNIRDILDRYKADDRVTALAQALNASKNPRVQLRGLVGSSDAAIAVALYFLQHKHMVFVLPEREEAGYFQADLENLTGKEVLLFPSSYRKPFEFTQPDSSNVLARAEVQSSYQPARRLWVRTKNGHYFPSPQMQLRAGDDWQPVYERLALHWIDRGCGGEIGHRPRPVESIQWVQEALDRLVSDKTPPPADPEGQQRLF